MNNTTTKEGRYVHFTSISFSKNGLANLKVEGGGKTVSFPLASEGKSSLKIISFESLCDPLFTKSVSATGGVFPYSVMLIKYKTLRFNPDSDATLDGARVSFGSRENVCVLSGTLVPLPPYIRCMAICRTSGEPTPLGERWSKICSESDPPISGSIVSRPLKQLRLIQILDCRCREGLFMYDIPRLMSEAGCKHLTSEVLSESKLILTKVKTFVKSKVLPYPPKVGFGIPPIGWRDPALKFWPEEDSIVVAASIDASRIKDEDDIRSRRTDLTRWTPEMVENNKKLRVACNKALECSKWYRIKSFPLVLSRYPEMGWIFFRSWKPDKLSLLESSLGDPNTGWKHFVTSEYLVRTNPEFFDSWLRNRYDDYNAVEGECTIKKMADFVDSFENPDARGLLLCPSWFSNGLKGVGKWAVRLWNDHFLNRSREEGSTYMPFSKFFLERKVCGSFPYGRNGGSSGQLSLSGPDTLNFGNLGFRGSKRLDDAIELLVESGYIVKSSTILSQMSSPDILAQPRKGNTGEFFSLSQDFNNVSGIVSRLIGLRQSNIRRFLAFSDTSTVEIVDNNEEPKTLRLVVDRFWDRTNENGGKYKNQRTGVILDEYQTSALACTMFVSCVCIVGLPGTGKTSVIESIMDLYDNDGTTVAAAGEETVFVVTHGGCMADGLERRGIKNAATIKSCLKRRYNDPNLKRRRLSAKVLVIDEFSNVSDELLAGLYAEDMFPNLNTVVHVYDPMQSQPIGVGCASLDYMSNFVSLDYWFEEMLPPPSPTSPGSNGPPKPTDCSKFLERCELLTVADEEELDEILPLGVVVPLKVGKRFGAGGGINYNDVMIVSGRMDKVIWNSTDFVLKDNASLDFGDPSNPLVKRMKQVVDSPVDESHQFLCLTNELCGKINGFCSNYHRPTNYNTKKSPPGFCKGFKLLTRERLDPIEIGSPASDIYGNPEAYLKFFRDVLLALKYPTDAMHPPDVTRDGKIYKRINWSILIQKRDDDVVSALYKDWEESGGELYAHALYSTSKVSVLKGSKFTNGSSFRLLGSSIFRISKNRNTLFKGLLRKLESALGEVYPTVDDDYEDSDQQQRSGRNSGKSTNLRPRFGLSAGLEDAEVIRRLATRYETMLEILSLRSMATELDRLEEMRWADPRKLLSTINFASSGSTQEEKCSASTDEDTVGWSKDRLSVFEPFLRTDLNVKELCKMGFIYVALFTDGYVLPLDGIRSTPECLFPGWAITVCFSQGTEYRECDLVLLEGSDQTSKDRGKGRADVAGKLKSFGRSEVHVACTRGKSKFTLYGKKEDFRVLAERAPPKRSSLLDRYLKAAAPQQ